MSKLKEYFKSSQLVAYLSGLNMGLAIANLGVGNIFMFWWCFIIGLMGIPIWVSEMKEDERE